MTLLVHKTMEECFKVEQPITFNDSVSETLKISRKSKYMLEIKDIIEQCEIPEIPSGKKGKKEIEEQIFKWNEKNSMLKTAESPSLKWQPKENIFSGRQLYVDGSTEAKIRFRLGNAIHQEQKQSKECVLCNEQNGNNESHMIHDGTTKLIK